MSTTTKSVPGPAVFAHIVRQLTLTPTKVQSAPPTEPAKKAA
jgi:hypothetical protein